MKKFIEPSIKMFEVCESVMTNHIVASAEADKVLGEEQTVVTDGKIVEDWILFTLK